MTDSIIPFLSRLVCIPPFPFLFSPLLSTIPVSESKIIELSALVVITKWRKIASSSSPRDPFLIRGCGLKPYSLSFLVTERPFPKSKAEKKSDGLLQNSWIKGFYLEAIHRGDLHVSPNISLPILDLRVLRGILENPLLSGSSSGITSRNSSILTKKS